MPTIKDDSIERLKRELQSIKAGLSKPATTGKDITINQNSLLDQFSNKLTNFLGEKAQIISKPIVDELRAQKDLMIKEYGGGLLKKKTATQPIVPTAAPTTSSLMQSVNPTAPEPASGLISPPGVQYTGLIDQAIKEATAAGDMEAAKILSGNTAYTPAPTPAAATTQPAPSGSQLRNVVPAQRSITAPGVFAGLREGIFGMPQSNVAGQFQGQEGRTTAYYAGKMLGDIVRSKMGVTSAAEELKLASTTPGTPQYTQAATAKASTFLRQHPMNLTPEELETLNADLERALPFAIDDKSKEELVNLLIKKHGLKVAKPLRAALGMSSGSGKEEELQALIQNLEEIEANR